MKHPRGIAYWPLATWHLCVTMHRHLVGRWFIFKDRPTWFVAAVAADGRKVHEPDADPSVDADIHAFNEKAREELRARNRQRRRLSAIRDFDPRATMQP